MSSDIFLEKILSYEPFDLDETLNSFGEDRNEEDSEDEEEFSNKLLPDGAYDFIIKEARIKNYRGNKVIPKCKEIVLCLIIEDNEGEKHKVYSVLYCVEKWKRVIYWFRKCVGLSQAISVNDIVRTCNTQTLSGRATITVYTQTNDFGEVISIYNTVDKYIPKKTRKKKYYYDYDE